MNKCSIIECKKESIRFWSFKSGKQKYILGRCPDHPPSPEEYSKWKMEEISEDQYIISSMMGA